MKGWCRFGGFFDGWFARVFLYPLFLTFHLFFFFASFFGGLSNRTLGIECLLFFPVMYISPCGIFLLYFGDVMIRFDVAVSGILASISFVGPVPCNGHIHFPLFGRFSFVELW